MTAQPGLYFHFNVSLTFICSVAVIVCHVENKFNFSKSPLAELLVKLSSKIK